MKRLIPIFAVLLVGLWMSCGDENGPTNNGDTTPRLVANTTVDEPSLSSPDEAVWSSVDSVTVPVKMGNAPKLNPPKVAAYPSEILVKAIKKGDKLYLRMQWSDTTFNAYPEHFFIIDSIPPIVFDQKAGIMDEDQIFVMFSDFLGGGYDVWNWRVLTTGGGSLGKGYTYSDATLTGDSAGTTTDSVTVENEDQGWQPTYAHKDTSGFEGHILYLEDTVHWQDTLYIKVDTIPYGEPPETLYDTTAVHFWNTTGWELGQKVPGWIIDSSFASLTDEERGSRWDIRAVSDYDNDALEYHVVLCRKLYTTFSDDMDLSAVDSVKVTIGIFDNQVTFEPPGSDRGFSNDFWIILP